MEETTKTMIICASKMINNHTGESYDDILEVENEPTTETIQEWANRIRGRIRKLAWEARDEGNEQRVRVTMDAAPPFQAMLINLQIFMKEEEGIIIELPGVETHATTNDAEALEIIRQLDERGNENG